LTSVKACFSIARNFCIFENVIQEKFKLLVNMDNYRKYIEDKGFNVTPQWEEFEQRVIYHKFNKNEIIVKAGSPDSSIYILENGCVRYFVITKNGKEFTQDIVEAPSALGTMFEVKPNEVSDINIQALTNSDVYVLKFHDFDYMNSIYPEFKKIGELAYTEIMKRRVIHGRNIATMTPEERYIDFLKNKSDNLDLVPQYIIASYLSIAPESLSRLRKRIKRNS